MTHECNYCGSKFTSKSNLNYHQKNTVYCLEKQGENIVSFECIFCDKIFSSEKRLKSHKESCIEYKKEKYVIKYKKEILNLKKVIKKQEEILNEKDMHIKELESRMENILIKAVSRPTTINTDNRIQNINNLIPITDDHMRSQSKFLTLDHIKQGALGYANFACDYALKDRIVCVDLSRRKIKYKNTDGHVVTDPEMTVLSKKFFLAIEEKNTELIQKYKDELRDIILSKYREASGNMEDTETKELEVIVEQINKDMQDASTMYYQTKEIVEGKKPEIYHEFIKEVCNKTIGKE